MIRAIHQAGRRSCSPSAKRTTRLGAQIGAQLWRTGWDIRDIWDGEYNDYHLGITNIIDRRAGLADYAGPRH
jgi:alpha-galactosidase